MPPKGSIQKRSRRRTATYTDDDGKFYNRPTIQAAPRAASPRRFDTVEEAVASTNELSRRLGTRSRSSTAGSATPGGGVSKPKRPSGKRPTRLESTKKFLKAVGETNKAVRAKSLEIQMKAREKPKGTK